MIDLKAQASQFLVRVEGLIDQGMTMAAVLAPEAIAGWSRTRLVVRCVRAELEAPGSAVKAAAKAMGIRIPPVEG